MNASWSVPASVIVVSPCCWSDVSPYMRGGSVSLATCRCFRPVMPRYGRGADDAARRLASVIAGVDSFRASGPIGTVEDSIFCTGEYRRHHLVNEGIGIDMSVLPTRSFGGHSCRNVSRKMETMGSSRNNSKKPMKTSNAWRIERRSWRNSVASWIIPVLDFQAKTVSLLPRKKWAAWIGRAWAVSVVVGIVVAVAYDLTH